MNTEERIALVETGLAVTQQNVLTLTKNQDEFRDLVLQHMHDEARETALIYNEINQMRGEVLLMPEKVSVKISNCQRDILKRIGDEHPRKHEVVTQKMMVVVVTLAISLSTLLFGVMSWWISTYTVPAWQQLVHKEEQREHNAERREQQEWRGK